MQGNTTQQEENYRRDQLEQRLYDEEVRKRNRNDELTARLALAFLLWIAGCTTMLLISSGVREQALVSMEKYFREVDKTNKKRMDEHVRDDRIKMDDHIKDHAPKEYR